MSKVRTQTTVLVDADTGPPTVSPIQHSGSFVAVHLTPPGFDEAVEGGTVALAGDPHLVRRLLSDALESLDGALSAHEVIEQARERCYGRAVAS
jgi:hypothetical protein